MGTHTAMHMPRALRMVARQATNASSTSQASGAACTSLYGHPAAGETLQAYSNYNITWQCSCLSTDNPSDIDITLYQYGGGALHVWQNVPCSTDSLTTQFKPTWWNSSTHASLQLQISESGTPTWASSNVLGPAFTVNWNGTLPASSSDTSVNSTSTGVSVESVTDPSKAGGVTGGKLAAAVTIPLLAAALGVAAYIFYSRRKGKSERKRWSAYVDHRLSQISGGSQWDPTASGLATPGLADGMSGSPSMMDLSQRSPQTILSGRPASAYSARSAANVAGTGLQMSASTTALENHSRSQSHSAQSALGRPASSFYALDGHSGMEAVQHMRQIGHGDRVSKVSFAESAFTNNGAAAAKRTSYFANGPGTASSPNHHRYKHSLGNSIASIPKRSGLARSIANDVTEGVDTLAPRPLSQGDVEHLARNIPSHDGTASRASMHKASLSETAVSPSLPHPARLGPGKKHNITVSTSMPAFNPAVDRQSILSPDDLLRAYASSKGSTSAMQRSESVDSYVTGQEHFDEEPRSADEGQPKSGKFRFGFGSAR